MDGERPSQEALLRLTLYKVIALDGGTHTQEAGRTVDLTTMTQACTATDQTVERITPDVVDCVKMGTAALKARTFLSSRLYL